MLKEKWVDSLSSKQLIAQKLLFQRGPQFVISSSPTPVIDYITATKYSYDLLGEDNLIWKIDHTKYYAKVKVVLTKVIAKPRPIVSNITKEEREALPNLIKMTTIWFLLLTKELP